MPIHNKLVDDFWRDKVDEIATKTNSIDTNISTVNSNIEIQSVQSTLNTSITPLGSGATFTGTYEQNNYSDIGVSCQTDNGGTLFFDFSPDGINTNTFPVAGFVIQAGIHEFHTAVKLGRYFRIRLVNDTGAQTYLRLYTYYGTFRQGNLPLGSTVNDDSDCILVRGPYNGIDIARGNIQSVSPLSKFGDNPAVSTSNSIISSSNTYQTPTSAQTLEILSSNANDASTGTGAQQVKVIGLDSTWAEVEEDILLSGTSPVTLSQTFIRVYRMYVIRSGTYATATTGSHAGTITLRGSGGGVIWAAIPFINGLGIGQSQIACYTVPTGKQFFIETFELSASTSKTATVLLLKRDNIDDVSTPFIGALRLLRSYDKIEGSVSLPLKGLSVIGPQTDIIVLSFTNAGTAAVSASLNGYLIDS